jgi:hypothetical protein
VKVLHTFPPNYAAINKAFKVRGKRIWFCYRDTIYNPSRTPVPPEIMVHEQVHSGQQGNDPAGWWQRYIDDPAYRLAMEIPAHWAECRHLVDHGMPAERVISWVARRLASPLYGGLITFEDACRALSGVNGRSTTVPLGQGSQIKSVIQGGYMYDEGSDRMVPVRDIVVGTLE